MLKDSNFWCCGEFAFTDPDAVTCFCRTQTQSRRRHRKYYYVPQRAPFERAPLLWSLRSFTVSGTILEHELGYESLKPIERRAGSRGPPCHQSALEIIPQPSRFVLRPPRSVVSSSLESSVDTCSYTLARVCELLDESCARRRPTCAHTFLATADTLCTRSKILWSNARIEL
jgi:hypothetical protein